MSRRRNLEHHRSSLGEIRGIMNSMKTLATMETHKLARFLDAQRSVVTSIESAARDLLAAHPEILPALREQQPVYLLIGSERGFCGDFNHALVRALEARLRTEDVRQPLLIAVGRKLHTVLETVGLEAVNIEGASVAEEIPPLLNHLVETIAAQRAQAGTQILTAICHDAETGVVQRTLLPPFHDLVDTGMAAGQPPLLNRSPTDLLLSLSEHYLFSRLHEMLYSSLMGENHYRVAHLEGAVRHLDNESTRLAHQCNALRQEEIIEEIEVILLSSVELAKRSGEHRLDSG
ncbi:MAG: F0F1 ATP synthase subunit gamma [Candidatus Thiodiazotropha sp.]